MRSKLYYVWWGCWLIGAALVAASWLNLVTVEVGWIGFAIGMVGFVGSRLRILNPEEAATTTEFDSSHDALPNERGPDEPPHRDRHSQ